MHSKAEMHLKNRDTLKQNHLLFTRASLKPVFYCFFRLPSVLPAPFRSSGFRPFFRLSSVFPAPARFSGSRLLFRLPSVLPAPVRFSGSRPLLPDTEYPKPILPFLFLSAHLFYGYAPDLFIFHAPDLFFFRHTNNEIGIFGSLTVTFHNLSRGFTVSYLLLSGLFRMAFEWLSGGFTVSFQRLFCIVPVSSGVFPSSFR